MSLKLTVVLVVLVPPSKVAVASMSSALT